MHLKTMIHYDASCSTAGSAHSYKGHFYEEVEFDIAEVSQDAAPVATVTRGGTETRWYDNHHYLRAYDYTADAQREPQPTTEEIISQLETGWVRHINDGYDCFSRTSERASYYSRSEYTTFDESAREAAFVEAEYCLNQMLLIDGLFWIRAAEPYLIEDNDWEGLKVRHDIPMRNGAGRTNPRSHSWLLNSKIRRGDDPLGAGKITILIPETIQRQPERDALLDVAIFLLDDYSYTKLEQVHPDIIESLSAVNRAIWSKSVADVDYDGLVESLERGLDLVSRHETETRINTPERIKAYRNCIETWNDRILTISDIVTVPSPGKSVL